MPSAMRWWRTFLDCFIVSLLSLGPQLVDAVEPPVDRNGPRVLERLVEVLPETVGGFLLRPVEVQRRPDRVQVLKRNRRRVTSSSSS